MIIDAKLFEQATANALNRIGSRVTERARRLSPFNTGMMSSQINFIPVIVGRKTLIIYCDSEHAADMEYGIPATPDMDKAEMESIKRWAHLKTKGENEGLAYGVIKKIKERGSNVATGDVGTVENPKQNFDGRYRPFMRPALHQLMPEIKKIIREEFAKSMI